MADGTRSFDAHEGQDPTALAAVYRAHARYVWRVLRHCGVPEADLDDAVQETFLVVFRRRPELERASLRTWIYAVAVRVASTRRRSQRREAARRGHAGERMHGAGAVDPEAELSKVEAAELVDRLLEELDATKRTVFVLAELEGVKVPEISRILGVNPRTVHSRLRLARESFGAALERLKAREEGNRRVARLRPRPLLEHAANDRPPAARRKAAMAALAMRIEQGAMPMLPGWETLALGSGWAGAWGLPAIVLGAVSVVTAAIVVTSEPETGRSPSLGGGSGVALASADSSPSEPPGASAAPEPLPDGSGVHFGTSSPMSNASGDTFRVPTPLSNAPDDTFRISGPLANASDVHFRVPTRSDNALGGPSGASSPSPEAHRGALASSNPSFGSPRTTRAAEAPAAEPHVEPSPSSSGSPPRASADSTDASTLAAETRLLEQARDALRRGDANAALTALDAHSADFPAGLLLDEARSTRLRALCAAGRSDEATALADRWTPRRPASAATGEPQAPPRGTSRWHDVVAAACR